MALPLRDSWLARALGGGDDRDVPSHSSKETHGGEAEEIRSASPADAALVDRLRAGDAVALTEIIAANVPALSRYAARLLRDEAEAEDIVQDVLARFWARRASLTVETTVRAYLFGAVRNIALNLHRHRRVAAVRTVAATEAQSAVNASPADTVLSRLTVDQLLAHLPERRRDAVVLRYLGELSYAEIAAVLGTTRVNAERLVARSLETLRTIVASGEKF
jgi:RNA polymerase sigma-70 factor (ECF subfamily)